MSLLVVGMHEAAHALAREFVGFEAEQIARCRRDIELVRALIRMHDHVGRVFGEQPVAGFRQFLFGDVDDDAEKASLAILAGFVDAANDHITNLTRRANDARFEREILLFVAGGF